MVCGGSNFFTFLVVVVVVVVEFVVVELFVDAEFVFVVVFVVVVDVAVVLALFIDESSELFKVVEFFVICIESTGALLLFDLP